MTPTEKFLQMFLALGSFVVFFAVVLFIISRVRGRANNPLTVAAFVGPTVLLLAVGLIYPAVLTIKQSFQNADSTAFVGPVELRHPVHESQYRLVLGNTFVWVLLVPVAATLIGLVYAVLVDRTAHRVAVQGAGLHPDGHLDGGRVDHLEVRLRLPTDRGSSRSAWPTSCSRRSAWRPTSSCCTDRGTRCSSSS